MDDDAVLVQRCLAGDAAAVRLLVEKFHGLVFGLCWRMLRQRQDAEDVTQETFARVFRYLGQWESSKPLRPWLMAIAANRCRTRLARQKTQPRLTGEWPGYAAESTTSIGLAEELQQGIDQLRDNYRLCFVMFYQQEMSVQEIAEALDSPPGTIKTWLHRARREVADRLRERGVVNDDGYELRGI